MPQIALTMSASATASADVARRAAAFVRSLAASLATSHAAADSTAVRAHVSAVISGLPTPTAQHKALREHLLQPAHFEAAVRSISEALSKNAAAGQAAAGDAQNAAASMAPLFSHAAYNAALAEIDERAESQPRAAAELQSYLPLLLPSASPSFVRPHLLRTLIAQAKALSGGRSSPQQQAQQLGASVAAFLSQGSVMAALSLPLSSPSSAECQHQIELQLRFVRALPVHHACCASIAAMIDRACVHLSSASAAALSTATTRRYQFLLASLLLEEAKRRPRESWAQAESQRVYATRVRTVLRCLPHPQPFTVSLAGELMFLQAAFDGLKEFKNAEKAHRAALLAKQQRSAAGSASSSSKRSRSRSRSPSLSALGSFHDVTFFHAPVFSAIWHPLLADVLGALGSGGRKEGDVETELLRLAILVRSVASASLVAALLPLQSSTVALAAAFPSRPIPLSLRPALQRFGSGSSAVTQCAQLWSARTEASSKVAQLSVAQLSRVLIELEGDVGIDEEDDAKQAAAAGSDDDEGSAADEDDAAESSSHSKKARFDEFGVSRKADAMFFLDSGAASSAVAAGGEDDAAAGGATTAAADVESDPASSRSVEASMSRILQSLPQAEPTQPAGQLSKKQKAAADKAAAASASKAAEELTKSQQAGAEEEDAESGVAPMQLDGDDENAAVKAEEEEEEAVPATKSKQKKTAAGKKSAAAKSTKASKEPEAAPADVAPTRSKRAAKSKQRDD